MVKNQPGTASVDADGVGFGIAITTVGRWDHLRRLLGDLAAQSLAPRVVAIAHHAGIDSTPELWAVVEEFADKLPIRTAVSARGASRGRNAAAATFTDDVEWILFPNDTSRIDEEFLECLAVYCVEPTNVCAVRFVDSEGSRNKLPAPGSAFDRRTAWGAIEPATAIRRRDFDRVGGFDPSIGTGAETPWQSGEVTDLLFRLAADDGGLRIEWIDELTVRAHTEFAHLTPAERRRKLRNYGRGSGYIYRRWRYPVSAKLKHLLGATLMPLRNPRKFRPLDGLMLFIGRAEGILGRTLGSDTDYRAVLR